MAGSQWTAADHGAFEALRPLVVVLCIFKNQRRLRLWLNLHSSSRPSVVPRIVSASQAPIKLCIYLQKASLNISFNSSYSLIVRLTFKPGTRAKRNPPGPLLSDSLEPSPQRTLTAALKHGRLDLLSMSRSEPNPLRCLSGMWPLQVPLLRCRPSTTTFLRQQVFHNKTSSKNEAIRGTINAVWQIACSLASPYMSTDAIPLKAPPRGRQACNPTLWHVGFPKRQIS